MEPKDYNKEPMPEQKISNQPHSKPKKMTRAEVMEYMFGDAQREPSIPATVAQAKPSMGTVSVAPPASTQTPPPQTSAESDDADGLEESRRQPYRKRDKQVLVRFSDEEFQILKKRAAQAGKTQTEFLRKVALTGPIPQKDESALTQAQIHYSEVLGAIAAELGRQGGMLKQSMTANRERRKSASAEYADVTRLIRFLERYAKIFREKQENIGRKMQDASVLTTLTSHLEETIIIVNAQGITLRDICLPEKGPRVYNEAEWTNLVLTGRQILAKYENVVVAAMEEINGCR